VLGGLPKAYISIESPAGPASSVATAFDEREGVARLSGSAVAEEEVAVGPGPTKLQEDSREANINNKQKGFIGLNLAIFPIGTFRAGFTGGVIDALFVRAAGIAASHHHPLDTVLFEETAQLGNNL
jgi:hypothetical protein